MDISIGILAGGKSRRMGVNKALLEYNNKTFLNALAEELSDVGELWISVDRREAYEDLPYPLAVDENWDIGPMEGIRQILKASGREAAFICATDMPFLKKELVFYMSQFLCSDYDCYIICDKNRIHPLCGIYSKSVLPVIEELIAAGDYKLTKLLDRVRTKYISLAYSCFSEKVVKNINTRQEYRQMAKPFVFCVSGVKNSGKTWLIERLINEFIPEYPHIGIIKHDGHAFCMDHAGTDTDRLAKAGAVSVAIFSKEKQALIKRAAKEPLTELLPQMQDLDLIIIEGMKHSAYPKVEVVRKGISDQCVCDQSTLIAVATDTKVKNLNGQIPCFPLEDPSAIAKAVSAYREEHPQGM